MRFFKKGNFNDVPPVLIGSVFFFVFLVIALLVWSEWNDGVQNTSVIPDVVKSGSQNTFNVFSWIADFIIPIIIVGSMIFSVMAARLIPSSPKFYIVSVLFIILLPLIMTGVNNFVVSFMSNTTIAGFLVDNLRITSYLLSHLVHISVIYSIIVGIALLSKDEVVR